MDKGNTRFLIFKGLFMIYEFSIKDIPNELKFGGIYCIFSKDGKKYIGSSHRIYRRIKEHRSMLRDGIHHNNYLQNTFNKYGEDYFGFLVIEKIDDINLLIETEQKYLDFFGSYHRDLGYNISPTAGNTLGCKQSEEVCRKKSERMIGSKNPFYGKRHSEEIRKIISENLKGKRLGIASGMKGKKHSEEAKKKIALAGTGRFPSQEVRSKISKNLKDSESFREYHKRRKEQKVGCRIFTDEDKEYIRQQYDKNIAIYIIAKEIKTSRTLLGNYIKEWGFPKRERSSVCKIGHNRNKELVG